MIHFLLVILSLTAHSEVLFEGYSRILSSDDQIGYIVQRYEFDAAQKKFQSVSYTRLNEKNGNSSESIKAVCNDRFEPISFAYTFKSESEMKVIDGTVSKGVLTLKVTDGKSSKTSKVKLPKGVFLSSFLGYLMLQNGIQTGKRFSYKAIAEEDGTIQDGQAVIQKEETFKEQNVYRIANEFKKVQYISVVTPRGEILATESPAQSLATELMKSPEEATKGQPSAESTLKLLFGKVPEGKQHVLAKAQPEFKKAAPTPVQSASPGAGTKESL